MIDILGEYDENAIPAGFEMPLSVDGRNYSINFSSHKILGSYAFHNQTRELCLATRLANFAARVANGEILVHEGKVYKKVAFSSDGQRCSNIYELLNKEVADPVKVEGNGHLKPIEAIVEAVKRRGMPKGGWPKK